MQLSPAQKRVLVALVTGCSLKSHRYLDGSKIYQLHPLTGQAETLERSTVELLYRQGLIDSNKKFPAATYWLTEKGKVLAIALKERQ
jgi:hypothetical protein